MYSSHGPGMFVNLIYGARLRNKKLAEMVCTYYINALKSWNNYIQVVCKYTIVQDPHWWFMHAQID